MTSPYYPRWLERQRGIVSLVQQKTSIHSGPKSLFGILVEMSGEHGCCHPSNAFLACRLGVKSRTVQTWIKRLVEERDITRRHLPYGADIPHANGRAVEQRDGIRLILIHGLWEGDHFPGTPYSDDKFKKAATDHARRQAKYRAQKKRARDRQQGDECEITGGDDRAIMGSEKQHVIHKKKDSEKRHAKRRAMRHASFHDHGGGDHPVTRKGSKLRGEDDLTNRESSLFVPIDHIEGVFPKKGDRSAWSPELLDEFEERAAILEFEGGMSRRDAERSAFEEVKSRAVAELSSGNTQ